MVKGSEDACDFIVAPIYLGTSPESRTDGIATGSAKEKVQPARVNEKSIVSLVGTAVNPSSDHTVKVLELYSKLEDRRQPKTKHIDEIDKKYPLTQSEHIGSCIRRTVVSYTFSVCPGQSWLQSEDALGVRMMTVLPENRTCPRSTATVCSGISRTQSVVAPMSTSVVQRIKPETLRTRTTTEAIPAKICCLARDPQSYPILMNLTTLTLHDLQRH